MFKDRLKLAAQEGILLAVKWGFVLAVLGGGGWWIIRDYSQVRESAAMGRQVYLYTLNGINAGKLPQDWSKPVLGPATASTPLPVPFVSPSPAKK